MRFKNTAVIRKRSGFTLIEVLVAVFFGAMVIVAATSFIWSMGHAWGTGSQDWLFHKHMRGVSRFLENTLQVAGNRVPLSEDETPIAWAERNGSAYQNREFLTFELDESPGVLVWPDERPLPKIVCSLDLDPREGLFLLWRSRLEEDYEDKEPRRTLISPFVTGIRYYYIENFEDENLEWEIEDEPEREADGAYIMPQRIELIFTYFEVEYKRQIVLPSVFNGVPVL